MLSPSQGVMRKLFDPARMASMRKKPAEGGGVARSRNITTSQKKPSIFSRLAGASRKAPSPMPELKGKSIFGSAKMSKERGY